VYGTECYATMWLEKVSNRIDLAHFAVRAGVFGMNFARTADRRFRVGRRAAFRAAWSAGLTTATVRTTECIKGSLVTRVDLHRFPSVHAGRAKITLFAVIAGKAQQLADHFLLALDGAGVASRRANLFLGRALGTCTARRLCAQLVGHPDRRLDG